VRKILPDSGLRRVLSAIVFLPIFWVIVKKFGHTPYALLMGTAATVALFELYRLAAARGHRCHRAIGAPVMWLFLAAFLSPVIALEYALLAGLFIIPLATLRRGGDWGTALGDIAATLFAVTFIGVLFGYLIGLRLLDDLPKGEETGSDLVFLLFFVVWASDTAAYYTGSAVGRTPLAPQVSPRKTVEGALGGVAGALAATFVARAWFMHWLSPLDCVILAPLLGVIGILGDLVESMLKRGAGVKDSASVVPGHGGILDRVDSVLYAAPVLYYYYLFAMRGQ
jgi:phosphatidate cytidylyltransferase